MDTYIPPRPDLPSSFNVIPRPDIWPSGLWKGFPPPKQFPSSPEDYAWAVTFVLGGILLVGWIVGMFFFGM